MLAAQKPGINSAGNTPSQVYDALWQTLHDGQVWTGHLKNRRPDGTPWWAYETLVPIVIGSQVVGYWGTVQECPAQSPKLVASPISSEASGVNPADTDFLNHLTFHAVFQPVVNLQSELVIGQDALIRLRYHGRVLSPLDVFAEAKRTGTLVQLDGICLQTIAQAIRVRGPWLLSPQMLLDIPDVMRYNPPS